MRSGIAPALRQRNNMRHLLLASLATVASLLTACAASPDGVSSEPSSMTPLLRHAPEDPGLPASTARVQHDYVIHSIDLGAARAEAWKDLGLDIDGKVTAAGSASARSTASIPGAVDTRGPAGGLCQVAQGAPETTHEDGVDGIDNAFGAHVVPALLAVGGSDLVDHLNASLASDQQTSLLSVTGIAPTGEATVAAALGGLALDRAWVSGGTLVVAPSAGEYQLVLGAVMSPKGEPVQLVLPVTHVQVVAPLSDDHEHVRQGVFSGILPAGKTALALESFVARVSQTPPEWVMAALDQTVREAADVLADGTQDAKRGCDGISIGFKFDADGTLKPLSPRSPLPLPRPADAPFARVR
jgi:hypothetical protein